ncbi:hypothetical protein BpHYR1_027544 [Brachionus plicatilis]|uniref:Uncharacterized protein n=1 Tax=Brachionus plicatilis TaxID=10195 RepID=A0A3M7SNG4_BRAPC|nr:hypothetical protein BpHYR1_027544 [Brachionus plicatilis]
MKENNNNLLLIVVTSILFIVTSFMGNKGCSFIKKKIQEENTKKGNKKSRRGFEWRVFSSGYDSLFSDDNTVLESD